MSKRSRRRGRGNATPTAPRQLDPPAPPASTQARPPPPPERLLLDRISAAELDPHLTAIADAIHARLELLETINSAKALAMLTVGDRVRFNHHTPPPIPAPLHVSWVR